MLERRKLRSDGEDLPPHAYVFRDDTGRMVKIKRLNERWRNVCSAANVNGLHPHLHDLRGEFASQLSESRVPVEQVRDALGTHLAHVHRGWRARSGPSRLPQDGGPKPRGRWSCRARQP